MIDSTVPAVTSAYKGEISYVHWFRNLSTIYGTGFPEKMWSEVQLASRYFWNLTHR